MRLVAVHAHPDDETLATGLALAHHARRGDDVHVITCTLGEEGEVIPPGLAHLEGAPGLAPHRRDELADALAVLGVKHELLGEERPNGTGTPRWRDSGMAGSQAAGHPDAFAGADPEEAAELLAARLLDLRPDVVLTYDPRGGYAHPDHVRTHDVTCAAVARLEDRPDLWAVVRPRAWEREDRQWLRDRVDAEATGLTVAADDDPFAAGVVEAEDVGHVLRDVSARTLQAEALRAHETQVRVLDADPAGGYGEDEVYALSNDVAARLAAREAYARLDPLTGALVPPDGPPGSGGLPTPAPRVDPATRTAATVVDTPGAAPPVDPDAYRLAIGRLVTGVCVITTSAGGHDYAMTANAVTSVSLDPVLLLVCVHQEARFHEAVQVAGAWGVSILADRARQHAGWLATPGRPLHGQLDLVPHHRGTVTGVPLLEDSLATFECRTRDLHPAGDHTIVVGEVVSVHTPAVSRGALVHHRGRFRTLGETVDAGD